MTEQRRQEIHDRIVEADERLEQLRELPREIDSPADRDAVTAAREAAARSAQLADDARGHSVDAYRAAARRHDEAADVGIGDVHRHRRAAEADRDAADAVETGERSDP